MICDFTTIPGWDALMRSYTMLSLEEARAWARQSGIKTSGEWRRAELPPGMPRKPLDHYTGKGWINWADFLGTRQRYNFRSFEEARKYAISLKLISGKKWPSLDLPLDVPKEPQRVYKEWISWPHFLGKEEPMTWEQACAWARQSGIKTGTQWENSRNVLPASLSTRPDKTYRNEWKGWAHFLGAVYISFEYARQWAIDNKINSVFEWRATKKPEGFPQAPESVYEDKWQGWNHFFGKRRYTFEEARAWARTSGIKGAKEWRCSKEIPNGIERNWPPKAYASEWKGWNDFLGKNVAA